MLSIWGVRPRNGAALLFRRRSASKICHGTGETDQEKENGDDAEGDSGIQRACRSCFFITLSPR